MTPEELSTYRSAFENVGIPALITDTNYLVTDVNGAGLDFIGYEYDEIVGQHVATIAGDEEILASLIETVTAGESWEGDFEVTTKDGHSVYGKGSTAPIEVGGDVVGFVAIFIDTTKQRQYRNAAEVLNRVLRHDLRNQLNIIYGFIQRAQTAAEEEAVTESLQTATDELTGLINKSERARDLREHLETRYDQPNESVRLDSLLNGALVEMVGTHEEADFRFGRIPAVSVYADDLLENVFKAVIDNAVVHSDRPAPTVEISTEIEAETVVVSIADDGPGIPEAHRDMVFGREEIDDLHHGSGVSLFFVDNVITSYNGDIWIEDNEPRGCVFNIRLELSE